MNLAEQALKELYPNSEEDRKLEVKYSAKFKGLNANVKYDANKLVLSLSKNWLEYSDKLRIGLIQNLLVKMYKKPYEKTLEMDLYEKFLDNVGKYAKREKEDPMLNDSFERINKKYFDNLMEKPNLVWGKKAYSKLGHYEYQTDTILISEVFKENLELLDFIIFHELLHKKHGLKRTKNGRNIHHSKAFRDEEAKYEDKDIEKKLKWFIRKKRLRNAFGL